MASAWARGTERPWPMSRRSSSWPLRRTARVSTCSTLADHPYLGERLDAYATLGFVLGRTTRLCGVVTVTNLPSRPAPILARTITSLSALSGGRVVLGIGAGGLWDEIVKLGVSRLSPGSAVRAMEEAIRVVRALSGGGDPVIFDGEFYQVLGVDPAPVEPPAIWTGAIGPKSLAVTGRLADGWIPGHASDWISETYRQVTSDHRRCRCRSRQRSRGNRNDLQHRRPRHA